MAHSTSRRKARAAEDDVAEAVREDDLASIIAQLREEGEVEDHEYSR